jgi:hypothetical protein
MAYKRWETVISSFYWAPLSKFRRRRQKPVSETSCNWINVGTMDNVVIFTLIYHCHKLIDLNNKFALTRKRPNAVTSDFQCFLCHQGFCWECKLKLVTAILFYLYQNSSFLSVIIFQTVCYTELGWKCGECSTVRNCRFPWRVPSAELPLWELWF